MQVRITEEQVVAYHRRRDDMVLKRLESWLSAAAWWIAVLGWITVLWMVIN